MSTNCNAKKNVRDRNERKFPYSEPYTNKQNALCVRTYCSIVVAGRI